MPERLAPLRSILYDSLGGSHRVVGRLHTARFAAVLYHPHILQQKLLRQDNLQISVTEVLLSAVDNRPHTLLHGMILVMVSGNAGVGLGFLKLSVNEPITILVSLLSKVGHQFPLSPSLGALVFRYLGIGERFASESADPVVRHSILIIHRHKN